MKSAYVLQCAAQITQWILIQKIPPRLSYIFAKWQIAKKDQKELQDYLLKNKAILTCKHNNQIVHTWNAHISALKDEAKSVIHVLQWAQNRKVHNVQKFIKHVQGLQCFHVFPNNCIRNKTPLNAINIHMLLQAIKNAGLPGLLFSSCICEFPSAFSDIAKLLHNKSIIVHDNRVWCLKLE